MHIKKCFTAIFISSAFLSAGLVNSHAAEAPVQQQKVAKPNVVILATGGTIAGSAASNTQMTGYKAGALVCCKLSLRFTRLPMSKVSRSPILDLNQ